MSSQEPTPQAGTLSGTPTILTTSTWLQEQTTSLGEESVTRSGKMLIDPREECGSKPSRTMKDLVRAQEETRSSHVELEAVNGTL